MSFSLAGVVCLAYVTLVQFKIPERIIFTTAIPKYVDVARGIHLPTLTPRHPFPCRTATGKIQRRHVRDKFVQDEAQKAKDKRQAKL